MKLLIQVKKEKKSFKNPFEKKQKTGDDISPQDDEISPVKTRSKKKLVDIILQQKNL